MTENKVPHRLLTFDVIARCAILGQALSTASLAWFVPQSLTSKLIVVGGTYGQTALILFSACVVVGLLDVLINDFLPPQICLAILRKKRHLIFHVLAGLYFWQAFVGVGDSLGVEDFLPLNYLLIGVISAWYSWAISVRAVHV